jgi:phage antirepressor YoqD-like protein
MSDTIVGTKEVAKQLKLHPKRLRAIMRANGMHAPKSGRYEFQPKDIAKLSAAIKEHDSKQPAKDKSVKKAAAK